MEQNNRQPITKEYVQKALKYCLDNKLMSKEVAAHLMEKDPKRLIARVVSMMEIHMNYQQQLKENPEYNPDGEIIWTKPKDEK